MALVYCHTNKINGKKYIGITRTSVRKRWGINGSGYARCPLFYCAIQKYGWDNFTHEIIKDNLSNDEASKIESELIQKFHTNDRNYGYNISNGGYYNTFGLSDSTKKKLSIARSKRVMCVESGEIFDSITLAAKSLGLTRNAVGNVLNGVIVSAKGFHFVFVDEESPKVRNAVNKSKSVICLETGEVFDSVKSAAERFCTCEANIKHCATGKYQKAKGYTFRYLGNKAVQE